MKKFKNGRKELPWLLNNDNHEVLKYRVERPLLCDFLDCKARSLRHLVFHIFYRWFYRIWSVCAFSWLFQLKNEHKYDFCSFSKGFRLKSAHMLQFFTYFAKILPKYGASTHFRSYSSWKMSINAVFAHFPRVLGLKVRICSSLLQIKRHFYQNMECLRIFRLLEP